MGVNMNENSIIVDNVSLKYRFVRNVKMKQELASILLHKKRESRVKEVQALKDVSFTIKKGSNCGIIGSNGAGKSTLLKLIAGIFEPDKGEIKLDTSSISLLSLGVGFVNDLSGVDNVYLNCLLMGLTKQQVDERLNDIIEYSGIGDFVYEPVRSYSSGMKSRLSFSTSIMVNPEILLVDEILGVGDQEFKKKSNEKMVEMINDKRTVLIVSHNMQTIADLCDTVIWLDKGHLMMHGAAKETIAEYQNYSKKKTI